MGSNKIRKDQNQIEEAKTKYFEFDCSQFAMARDSDYYKTFKELAIPEKTLFKWRCELLQNLYVQVEKSGSADIYGRMYNVGQEYCNKENLQLMKNALEKVYFSEERTFAYIAEILIGRKSIEQRDGLIFIAFDLGEKLLAKELIVKANDLLNKALSNIDIRQRVERDIRKCAEISQVLLR